MHFQLLINQTQRVSGEQKFQKYPKNYQENHHYKSVKEKLMTAEQDDQDIIKFPYTSSLQLKKNPKQYSPYSHSKKFEKLHGKKFEAIPVRTINYSTPINPKVSEQLSQSSKTSRKSDSINKFASKNLFTNMKKLKDLRKTNYKSRLSTMQKKPNPQKPTQPSDNLDLFKLTSTNFKYKQKMFSDDSSDMEFLRKLTQTQTLNRNVIKFQKPKKSDQKGQAGLLQHIGQENQENGDTQSPFFVLVPVKTQEPKSAQKHKSKTMSQTASSRSIASKHQMNDRIVSSLIDDQTITQENVRAFVRYSQSTIQNDNEVFRNGMAKLRQISSTQKSYHPFKNSDYEHIPHSFKATFRVKHIDDNKNILLTTIKKKANVMDRNELVQYLKKVVK